MSIRMSSETRNAKYVYVPSSVMLGANFVIDDVFAALGFDLPNLMFQINSSDDVISWNLRMPSYKSNLVGTKHPSPPTQLNPSLRHYQGVVRENCKRLLRGTATACGQAGAIFRVDSYFDDEEPIDYVGEWLSDESSVPILAIAETEDYHTEIVNALIEKGHPYNANSSEEDEEKYRSVVKIDVEPWMKGIRKPERDSKGRAYHSIPHCKASHVILTDNPILLEQKIGEVVPTGLIVIHGGVLTTKYFCDAIQKGRPIFLFKYTGSTADLACEMLKKVETFLYKRRVNPRARPEQPFKTDLPLNYMHPRWLWPFDESSLEICRQLNILIENFPDRYNAASVLQIDMFNTRFGQIKTCMLILFQFGYFE